jgi:hypothetical protein
VQDWSILREAWQACYGDALHRSPAEAPVIIARGNLTIEQHDQKLADTGRNASCHMPGACTRLYSTSLSGELVKTPASLQLMCIRALRMVCKSAVRDAKRNMQTISLQLIKDGGACCI